MFQALQGDTVCATTSQLCLLVQSRYAKTICKRLCLFMDNEVWISYNFHILQSAVLWIFPNHLKAQTPFLLHKLYKNQQQGGLACKL